MNIALDAMGGDYAPSSIIEGAVIARKEVLPADFNLMLVGKEDIIKSELERLGGNPDDFIIVHASEVVEMAEHPTKAISQKRDSSIFKGFGLLMQGKADVFCSAGNTGAMLVGSMFTIKSIEGVIRPGIAGFFPKDSGRYGTIVDVGANADCKPDVLNQFAEMGYVYHKNIFGVENPTVGLLSLGTEETKGTLLTQAAFQLLKLNSNINFIGNIEGRDIMSDKVDVIVCDGYTGNVVLKLGESMYPLLEKRGFVDNFVELFNHQNVGGSPILGVNGNVIIAHGDSNPKAIKNLLNLAVQTVQSNITEKIKAIYK